MSDLNRLFGAGRRVRFALCLSLILLALVGGWLTAWPMRLLPQEPTPTEIVTGADT